MTSRTHGNMGRAAEAQQGVALLTALLVVFIATVTATQLVHSFQMTMARTTLALGQRQAWYYALGGEAWALQILRRDAEETQSDHPGEEWAEPARDLPIEGGVISVQIEDLQGRFNLNALLEASGEANADQVSRLERLLGALDVETGLAQAIADWVDADSEQRFPDGAEAVDYLLFDPPYVARDGPFTDKSELRLVKGISDQVFRLLEPHLSALPIGSDTRVNVNFASAPVIQSLHTDLAEADAEAVRESLGAKGFATVEDFLGHPAISSLGIPAEGLSVGSVYFLVRTVVDTDYGRTVLRSLVARGGADRVEVLSRALGETS